MSISAGKDGYFVSEGFSRQLPLATAAHTAPIGPVTRLAGVVPLPGFQNRTQALTGASLGSPSFSPTFSRWHHGQLPLQVVIHRLLDEADGKSQGAIPNFPISSLYFRRFNTDEPFFLQLSNILCNRVGAHASVLTYASDAWPALVRFPVLTENQVGVDGQLTGGKSQSENLIGQKKIMAKWTALSVSVLEFRGVTSPIIF